MRIVLFLLVLSVSAAYADTTLTLTPGGDITGMPGQTVGWGFDLTSDPLAWTTIVAVIPISESNPGLGSFFDLISPWGGPSNGSLPSGAADWAETFNATTFSGFGSYTIDPLAQTGDSDTGQFLVEYEQFSADPALCLNCLVNEGTFLQNFSVTTTPEPSSFVLLLTGVALCNRLRARKRRRTAS